MGFLSLLQLDDVTREERDDFISIIHKSADRLMNTINDILEISQIQSGQSKLRKETFIIHDLVQVISSRFKPEAENKGLEFKQVFNIPESIRSVSTDLLKLKAILTYLLDNAVKFTKKGEIDFGIYLKDDFLCFYVKDTGVGIPKNKQKVIYERFRQADSSNSRQFEGSGLGLAIAKAYVEMLGGVIWVDSEEGKGSTFYFTIPYPVESEQKNEVIMPDRGSDNSVVKLNILITEDDETSEQLISLAVKKMAKKTLKVKTGKEAVEICRTNPDLDLILMDIQMPGMNGYEATRQIRQFNKEIIIIAQTAYGLFGDREKAIESGCNDFVTKPINISALKETIRKHFK